MLSAPDMAPKVSQGVTTVVAGNCGISLAPAPRRHADAGARRRSICSTTTGAGSAFRRSRDYVEELRGAARQRPTARCWSGTPCCACRRWTISSARRRQRKSRRMRELVRRGAGGGRHRRLDRPLLRAGARRDDRGSDRGVPAAAASATASTARTCATRATGVVESLEESFRIGRELGVPVVISHHKVRRHAEPRPLGRDAADHREGHALAEDRPRLLSLLRLVDDPVLRAARSVAATTLVTWSKPHPEFAGIGLTEVAQRWDCRTEATVATAAARRRDLLLHGRGRCAAHPRLRAHHDRLRRPAARRRAASAPVGHVPARARATIRAA